MFGALTVIPLFLLTAAFLRSLDRILAAGFWAVGVNAISINRIGKEDTLLVFFMLFGFYFYLSAKQTSTRDLKTRGRNYLLSGISFGLMLASKYFPNYLGLNALYHQFFHVRKSEPGEPPGKTSRVFYIALVVAFLVANPPVLLPQVWTYLNAYMGEKLLVHSGYLFADHLYINQVSEHSVRHAYLFLSGVYGDQDSLLVLGAFIVGLIVSIKRRAAPGVCVCPLHVPAVDSPVFVDWSEMAALHAFADAVCLHAGGNWRVELIRLINRSFEDFRFRAGHWFLRF